MDVNKDAYILLYCMALGTSFPPCPTDHKEGNPAWLASSSGAYETLPDQHHNGASNGRLVLSGKKEWVLRTTVQIHLHRSR